MSDDVVEKPRVIEVILSETGEAHMASQLLAGDRREWADLRAAHEDAYLIGNPIVRCAACHRPVKPRMSPDKRRYFWHFHKNAQCPYQGKAGPSQRILDAMRYNGQKEGPEHQRIKRLLTNSLLADPSFSHQTLASEQRWWGVTDEKKWRVPDVSISRGDIRVAFEVQLSTTYLSVMRERHRFYLNNGGLLFWIFKKAETFSPRQMQEDIFYSNNSNLFVVDDETARLSLDQGELVLRCHYLEPQKDGLELWRERLVRFSELTLDASTQRAFWFDNEAARQAVAEQLATNELAELRERYLALWRRPDAGLGEEIRAEHVKLIGEIAAAGVSLPPETDDHFRRFAWICLSAAAGMGVGHWRASLLEVANYAFTNCPQLVHYFLAVAKKNGKLELLLAQDEEALAKRKRTGKVRESWRDRIEGFRRSYPLPREAQDGRYPVDRTCDGLLAFLFPAAGRGK